MSKIAITILLIIVSFLPESDKKDLLDQELRSKLNNGSVTSAQEITNQKEIKIPEKNKEARKITARAKSAYFVDLESGVVLFEKNSELPLPPASLAKLMTALVVIDQTDPNEIVTVGSYQSQLGDARVGLTQGDKISVEELLHGLLITSGSDAALVLASHVAGTPEKFTALMNEYAKILGLKNTHFTNPVGWDEEGNYSTAKDMTNLAQVALKNEIIKKIAQKRTHLLTSELGKQYLLINTNQLLVNQNYHGLKTGTTPGAGECFLVYYKDGSKEIVGAILNSSFRFNETQKIINMIDKNFNF